jgi:3-phenylpropionate/cinnamic acid dioxygenase small subunit
MAHFDEDKYSLGQRVARMGTEHVWAEDPPSRLRHFVTNVRTFESDPTAGGVAHLVVESAELLFRSRGDVNESALVSCGREDLLRWCDDRWKLARRRIIVDESVLRMQNLAVFL